MNKTELVQSIGNDICDDCGPNRDCGLELDSCDRIASAETRLNGFLEEFTSQPVVEADANNCPLRCDCLESKVECHNLGCLDRSTA